LQIGRAEGHKELEKILFAVHKFEVFQNEHHFFDEELIQKTINQNINFYFKRLSSHRLKFMLFILKEQYRYFKILSIKTKVKFVFKSIFKWL
jgi:hypothetical protein